MNLSIIGAGLAGSEAALQAAERGIPVHLIEMRPLQTTPAHVTEYFAELVCSNSLGSDDQGRAPGLLKAELGMLRSFLLEIARKHTVPAGSALAVDRTQFATAVTKAVLEHPLITVIREEAKEIPSGPTIIATGPLTSSSLAQALTEFTGEESLQFFDALAPIVSFDTIDMSVAFRGSRYGKGDPGGDYINCPFTKEEYLHFYQELHHAEQIQMRQFEQDDERFFEACLPVEVIASRGKDSLLFGPLRPVGLTDPRNDDRPHAVVQLRQDNLAGTLYNLVGFQTNLKFSEQERVFRLIPGLEKADFVRFGQMHRNTFVNSPTLLQPTLQTRKRADLFLAGQITGAEGYVSAIATGLLTGMNVSRLMKGQNPVILPPKTMLGALVHYITHADPFRFQPMKSNFGLLPPPEQRMKKPERYVYYSRRALDAMARTIRKNELIQ
ncbi:MAG: methylenetetrahydrofolate--tRNA-(uracil(54)-C(5))-methyltransferase (FADH(2)-oxidizing) TrmFO [Chloroflexota bacterium]